MVKILSQKPILHTELFDVIEYHVEKDGKTHVHDNIIEKDAVFVVPVTEDKKVYLIKQYRYLLGKEMVELIAGVVDSGESVEEAAKRELKEEAGIRAKRWTSLGKIDKNASIVRSSMHFFLAEDLEEGEQELDSFEDIEVMKMPFQQAIEMVMNGEIHVSGGVLGLLFAEKYLEGRNI